MASANRYDLSGKNSRITFIRSDVAGMKQLTWNGKIFHDIISENTASSQMVSAVTEVIHDQHTKKLAVFIPPVNIDSTGGTEKVSTLAIFSTHRTNFAGTGALDGQLIEYKVEKLKGSATIVHT